MPDFVRILQECHDNFTRQSPWWERIFKGAKGPWYLSTESVPPKMAEHYKRLLESGRVVWGSIAQANLGIFSEGPSDLPAVTVYSPDRYFDSLPHCIADIGHACYALKNTVPDHDAFKPIAARLTDEFDQTLRLPVPDELTCGKEVYLGATLIQRTRLPGGYLKKTLFPLVISPEQTAVTMVLPLHYWAAELRENWESVIESLPEIMFAERIAWTLPKRQWKPTPGVTYDGIPIWVTREAAEAYQRMLNQLKFYERAYLAIGYYTEGPDIGKRYLEVIMKYDANLERCYESNGVRIVLRVDQIHRFTGAVLDYVDLLEKFNLRFPYGNPDTGLT